MDASKRSSRTDAENSHQTGKAYSYGTTAAANGKSRRTRRALGDVTNKHSFTTTGKAGCTTAAPSTFSSSSKPTAAGPTYEFEVDARDAGNPQCATVYLKDMYHNYRKAEGVRAPNPNYMSAQKDITPKMRAILLDWLVEVHLKFKFELPTLYLTVNLIDRFLERKVVLRQKLQLVGVTAMLLASKYEEMYAPEVADFVYLTDRAYTKEEILATESTMLNTLSFRLSVPTIWVFLCRFAKLAGLTDRKSYLLARYYAERTLQEYKMLKYLPSNIAASAVYMAMKVTNSPVSWSKDMQRATTYTETTIKPCVNDMVSIINKGASTTLQAVCKKYSGHRYQRVAKIPLPSFD